MTDIPIETICGKCKKQKGREGTDCQCGRPDIYSEELSDLLCMYLAQGMSLKTACKQEGTPGMTTVFKWMREHPEFMKKYEKAKEESADALAEEIMDIADSGGNDWMEHNDPDNPGYKMNGEHIQRSRLRVDVRKWYLSKIKPKKYGEKLPSDNDGNSAQGMIMYLPPRNDTNDGHDQDTSTT